MASILVYLEISWGVSFTKPMLCEQYINKIELLIVSFAVSHKHISKS